MLGRVPLLDADSRCAVVGAMRILGAVLVAKDLRDLGWLAAQSVGVAGVLSGVVHPCCASAPPVFEALQLSSSKPLLFEGRKIVVMWCDLDFETLALCPRGWSNLRLATDAPWVSSDCPGKGPCCLGEKHNVYGVPKR